MHTYPLEAYMVHVRSGDWVSVAELMIDSAVILARCGAEFAICPDNTIHRAFDRVVESSPIPWLNMADTVAAAAKEQGFQKLGITGTKYLTTGFSLQWEAPQHGFISFAVNDNTYFNNAFHDGRGGIDFLGLDIYPAVGEAGTSSEGLTP